MDSIIPRAKSAQLCLLSFYLIAAPSLFGNLVNYISNTTWTLPESLSLAPAGFGSLGGQLVVPDAGTGANNSIVYGVPTAGGAPSQLTTFAGNATILTGTFLPATYGTDPGQYVAGGYHYTTTFNPMAYVISGAGLATPIYANSNGTIIGSAIASSTFGPFANDLLLARYDATSTGSVLDSGAILVLDSAFNVANTMVLPFAPDNLLVAPAGFGTVEGDVLVSSFRTGNIYAVDSSGNAVPFATLPLFSGQVGLRQMAIAPAGFGTYGGDLFVSVGSSTTGGGCCGSVDVVSPQGQLVAVLNQGTVGLPFDPRGLFFESTSQLLIADADPGILSAVPGAFTPLPEPATWSLFGAGLLMVGAWYGRSRVRSWCPGARKD